MDLYAYTQIDSLEKIAKENGIYIPRLRGYRLMKDEEFVSKEEIEKMKKDQAIATVRFLCETRPVWNPSSVASTFDSKTDELYNYYLIKDKEDGNYIDIRWDRIHGKKRKILKYEIKESNRMIEEQFNIWNKYVGREDVLYIHSRMGGNNWKYYEDKESIINQPWFLDRVDDYWDCTYCDFYAKIKIDNDNKEVL